MSSPAALPPSAGPPPAAPRAIRAWLPSSLAAEFDQEWTIVLERVKQSQDLSDLHAFLNKWRHTAHLEMREPGAYARMMSKAEQIIRTGERSNVVTAEDMQALIRQRQGR